MISDLSIQNLSYEELVFIQEIVLKLSMNGCYEVELEDEKTLESLYNKVMSS